MNLRNVKKNFQILKTCNALSNGFHSKGSNGVPGYDLPPLTKSLPSSNLFKYANINSNIYDTHISTLSNGLRVASEKMFGNFCTVGVIIDAGPRYEKNYLSGVTHFLEKLSFNSSTKYENRDTVMQVLEKHGAISDCQSARDAIIYAVSCERSGLKEILNLLAESIYRPTFSNSELEQVRTAISYEIEDLNTKPDPESLLNEMIHAAAYQSQTLGNPKFCPTENIQKIDTKLIYSFMKMHYKPERMVLACAGCDHESFVQMAEEVFSKTKPIWNENASLCDEKYESSYETKKAIWSGGLCINKKEMTTQNDFPELAHLVIGLESPSLLNEKDFVASCVINTMMGGGGSFSAGGPGKGMYSRLYVNVLNCYHFMFNATAYNQSYADSGLFCIHAASPPNNFNEMCAVITNELLKLDGPIEEQELARAKMQLQSMLFMNLEQRPVQFEDIARQVLSRGKREQAKYYFEQIKSINEQDIRRVAKKMLSTKVAVAALGNMNSNNVYERVESQLNAKASTKFRKLFQL